MPSVRQILTSGTVMNPNLDLGPDCLKITVTLSPSELCLSPLSTLRTFFDLFDVGFGFSHLFVIFLFDVFVPRSSIDPGHAISHIDAIFDLEAC